VPALFVSYSGLLGGAEQILLDVAQGLEEPPTIACPEGALASAARTAELHVLALPERRLELRTSGRDRAAAPLRIAALGQELRAVVGALRPDVVFAWGMRAALAATTLGRDRPPLVFQHNDLLPGPAIARAVRAAAWRADASVALSDCIARDLDPRRKLGVRVLHPGVDLDRFAPAPLPDGPPEVLVLGAIVDWKRPELALDAVALAARERPDLRLRLGGAPIDTAGEHQLEMLSRRAEQPDLAGRVELAGPLTDVPDALRRASCLLHCADREPFGRVLAEALAAGRPVVAPAACGPLEVLDESCARLYPPGDAEAAARALLEALDQAEELGAAGRARAERLFGLEDARGRYRELVAAMASARGRASGEGVAVVTVTHDSERELPGLLRSVERHMPGARVLVVDSGSSDGSAALARSHGAAVIELSENVGFGRASNAGVAAVSEPVTVLANPDVELLDGSLAKLAAELKAGGAERLLAPLVLLPDGSRQDVAQAEPGTKSAVAIALAPPALMPPPLRRAACPWTDDTPRQVGWAVGCCLVARTDTLRRLGPFDERIFLYGEDLELGLRAADVGVETWFRPDARVLHHRASSSGRAFGGEPFELLARQRRAVVRERRGATRARLDGLLQAATFADRIALKWLARRDTARERRQLRAVLRPKK
jgi:GT2 family glycosyltransferase/glycosyltransferase involved in cell wall biosynthesis